MENPPWLLFFLILLHPQEGQGESREGPITKELIGTMGKSVTLSIQIPEGQQMKSISWIFQSTLAKIEYGAQGEPPTVIVADPRYKIIVNIPQKVYSLQISNLSKEDEGSYETEMVVNEAPDTLTQKFRLLVYRILPKPKVIANFEISAESACNVTLKCLLDKTENGDEYSWIPWRPGAIVSEGGSVLHLSWKPGDKELTSSTCIIRNPVSLSSHSVPVGKFCIGFKVPSSMSCSPLMKVLFFLLLLGFLTVVIIIIIITKNQKIIKRRIHRGMKLRKSMKKAKNQANEFPLTSARP